MLREYPAPPSRLNARAPAAALVLWSVLAAAGCSSPPEHVQARPKAPAPAVEPLAFNEPHIAVAATSCVAPVVSPAAAAPVPGPAPVAPPAAAAPVRSPADALLAFAEALRHMPAAELAQEVSGMAEPGDAAPRLMRLALALNAARSPAHTIRAQVLLQRVLAQNTPEAQALHPLARLLAAHIAEARRFDEQLDRQNQHLREAQRRIEQLNDRLEAVRAIERSLTSRPLPPAARGQAPRF